MRVGLVLGAGGVIGGAWLMGALEALEAETGWRAADAEQIVGTSAGAVIGALAAAGVAPEYMSAYAAGKTLDDVAEAEARAAATAQRASAGDYHLHWAFPPIGPGLVAPGDVDAAAAAPPLAGGPHRRLAAARVRVHGADPRRRRDLRRRQVARALLGRRGRLRDRAARRVRTRGRAAGERRRRCRRVVRDPRLLPPGQHRRHALRRRRHLLGLEPRPPVRRRPRPRHLPEPDVVARAGDGRLARPTGWPRSCARPPAAASATRRASCARPARACWSSSPASRTSR